MTEADKEHMTLSRIYELPKRGKCGTYGEIRAQLLGLNPATVDGTYYAQDALIRCGTEEDYVRLTSSNLLPDADSLIHESEIGVTDTWRLRWVEINGEKKLTGYPKGDWNGKKTKDS